MKKKNSGSKKKIALGIGIGAALVGIVGVAVYAVRRFNKSMNSVAYSISHSYCSCDDCCCDVDDSQKNETSPDTATSPKTE